MNATAKTALKSCTCSLVVAFTEDGRELTTGCTATTKRTFAPGHDARLKGFLIRNGAEGNLVRVGDDVNTSAQAVANQFGFSGMVADGIAKAQARAIAKKAPKAKAPKKVTAKVGRWFYEGIVEGDEFVYTDKRENVLRATKFTLA